MNTSIRRGFSGVCSLFLVCTLMWLTPMSTEAAATSDNAQIVVSGQVVDARTGETMAGVNVSVVGRIVGVATGTDGRFTLRVNTEPPITVRFSLVGYETKEIEVNQTTVSDLRIELSEQTILGSDVVVSASRVEQSILDAPVSIEKMDIIAVNQTAAATYYQGIANLKGVDVTTSSINFQIVNSRGFNSTGNTRMVQLIDGMDTQAPALNFPIGNLNGPSELDVESVEYIPGAASALYGPNAFNGILQINSKSPFQYPGLSVFVKSGVNHVDGNTTLGEPSSVQPMFETSIRYAQVLNDRFAFKANFSYMQAKDWHGINYSDKNASLQGNLGVNPAFDGMHMYGDDGSFNIALLGFSAPFLTNVANLYFGGDMNAAQNYTAANMPIQPVNRTGYQERHLVDYDAENMKINTSLHYRLTDNAELSYTFNYGYGTSVYTGAQRYSLKNFNIAQHKLELRGDNYMVRAYGTFEDSGDSYIADFVGFAVNEAYSPSPQWFGTYGVAYLGALLNQGVGFGGGATAQQQTAAHVFARGTADANRIEPGTPQFDAAVEAALGATIPNGALFDDKSRFYHAEGQYDFKNEIDFMDLQLGLSFRQFQLRSNGTIFDDAGGIDINEFGGYLQGSKSLLDDRLRLTGSLRYDKNENFDGQLSPRISAVVGVAPNHNVRASFQTGFRNPTTQGQYIDLNVVTARLLGGLPQFADKYSVTQSTYTIESVQQFTNSILTGAPNPGLLVPYSTHNPVKPEQIQAYEIGYKGLLGNRLFIDAAYYYNIYDDFITQIRVRQLQDPNTGAIIPPNAPGALQTLLSGDFRNTFQIYTNSDQTVKAQGMVLGLDYSLPMGYRIGFNYNWNKLITDLGSFQNDFNTPEHKVNVSFGNRRVTEYLGFNVTYRWQDAFRWESSFAFMDVDAISTLDAQISYRVPSMRSVVKVGGSNLFNTSYTLSGGGPNLGAIYYVSLTFDQFLNR